ncbi:MAG TPA: hypothetical protein VFD36_17050 [Kofleriaceae bacterium]|nr:hypothetical protein [Kofleriaceae bacterium]
MHTSSGWTLAVLAACGADQTTTYVARDPCAPLALTTPAATSDELDGIAAARALWRDRGVAAFDPVASTSGSPIAIRFDDAAEVFHGVYDPESATIVINRAITDRATLAIVIAHELGHVFGLAHVAAVTRISLMNPGNLATPPTDADQRTLEALWGACR